MSMSALTEMNVRWITTAGEPRIDNAEITRLPTHSSLSERLSESL
jgi:hypothetical protein